MGFNIKNNWGPNIEVNEGGKVTLVQGKDGLWHTADAEDVEFIGEEVSQGGNVIAAAESVVLKPHFFKTRLFDSDARLQRLRSLIANSMDLGEHNAEFGQRNDYCINPKIQGEWYYVMRAIVEARIATDFSVPQFVEMMLDWYPCLKNIMDVKDREGFKRKISRSISHERSLWKYGKTKEDTGFKDMWARCQQLGIDSAKLERVYNAAYTELCVKLADLRKELEGKVR